jgi:type I restriction enzyme M protein
LARLPEYKVDMVLTNPPFGTKSSITVATGHGKVSQDRIGYSRPDFWATTSNKQLNFLQHVYAMLKVGGRAAIVVPDNVLFEGGAGERIRRELLKRADVHTLLRLPPGIWYSAGVKANVLFFDKKPSTKKELWIYDLRTNKNFTLRQNPITSGDLMDFVKCYGSNKRGNREESERFRRYHHADILAKDRANLDLLWLSDDSYSNPTKMPSHHLLAAEVVSLLKAAVGEFEAAVEVLEKTRKKKYERPRTIRRK